MTTSRLHAPRILALRSILCVTLLTAGAAAQSDRPDPAAPRPAGAGAPPSNGPSTPSRAGNREMPADGVKLAFNEVAIDEFFGFIAESTGKVVVPINLVTLKNKKITLVNDFPIQRAQALDMIFQAFRLNGIGVIERDDLVIVGNIDEIAQLRLHPPVLADEDVMSRLDKGSLILKFFRLKKVKAEVVAEKLQEFLPTTATTAVDTNSNQILVYGDVAICQHVQQIIWQLDNIHIEAKTITYRLAYADATEVADMVLELYEGTGGTSGASSRGGGTARPRTPQRGRADGQNQVQVPRAPGQAVGPEIELRVSVSTQQNSVTVVGEPAIVTEIGRLITEEWDRPRAAGTSKIFTLRYTDPLKVAEKLNSLLGQGSSSSGGRGVARGSTGQGTTSVDQILSGIYRLEPYPDTSQLLVFSKTEQSLSFLEDVIEKLDQPTAIGLPFVVELKHASAFELAEQINALLAEAGSGATIARPEEGLSGANLEDVGGSGGGETGGAGNAGQFEFPWQRGGRQRDDQSPESPLIGKVRIVPISRQNALAVLCPRPQEAAVKELISFFDRPGRQVMISVIIAEIELRNDFSLGLRFSSSDSIASAANPDNFFTTTAGVEATEENFLSDLFDTSVLTVNANLNAVLQALDQDNNLRVIQQPVIFTADNQEAFFFDGQEIPFITQSTLNSNGNPVDSFEYKDVGVILNARPRITRTRDIDMEIRLELSAVVPGQTLFGGAIIDRRQSKTNVVIKNGQTIVLSGIMKETESKIVRKVPFIGDIPLLGELFRSRENQTIRSELVAFITPVVVDNPDENDANFQQDYRRILDQFTSPVNDQFDLLEEDPEKFRNRLRPPPGLRDEMKQLEERERRERGEDIPSAPGGTFQIDPVTLEPERPEASAPPPAAPSSAPGR